MATIAEQLTSLANTKTAIKDAIVAKGVAVSDDVPFSGYAAKIGQIESGGGGAPATKFGASIDTFIGDVDENGVLTRPSGQIALNFAGVKEVSAYALFGLFEKIQTGQSGSIEITADLSSVETVQSYGMSYIFAWANLVEVDVSNIKSILRYGLYNAFCGTNITQISFRSLIDVDSYGLGSVCEDCSSLVGVIDLGNLVEAKAYSMQDAFSGCTKVTGYNFDSLQTVGATAFNRALDGNTSVVSLQFPSLTSVQSNSFGSSSTNDAFRNCTGLTEIHFRADMQATIEAMSRYANKWGATNATIYFDL